MSTHLLIAAMYLDTLPQGSKLVLAAIADSGDEHTLESAPGLPKIRAWSGLGKSQALRVVAQLVEDGYLERVAPGRVGRRAVFRVFPGGVPDIPHPGIVAARFTDTPEGSHPCDPPDVLTIGDNPVDNTLGRVAPALPSPEKRVASDPLEGRTHATPSCTTSVFRGSPSSTGRPPTPSTASGFPGSRSTIEEDKGIARRSHGANNMPCPLHPDQIVPCGRCAHKAAEDRRTNPDHAKNAAKAARALIAAAKHDEEATP